MISDKNPNSAETEELDGISIARVNRLTLMGIFGKRELAKALLKNDPDVIVWYGSPLSVIYLNQLRKIGKPVIWDIDMDIPALRTLIRLSLRELFNPDHNLFLPQLSTIFYPKLAIRVIANSRFVSKIVVPSQSLRNSMCAIGVNPEKIRVIPSTIERRDPVIFGTKKKASRSTLGFDETEFVVTYFGSPCTLRGTDTAIMSMKQILAFRKDVKLMILSRREKADGSAGGKYVKSEETYFGSRHLRSEEDYLRKLIEQMGIGKNVRILPGVMNKDELISYLLLSDIIVLPFKIIFSEPPLSVLEAMNLGKVVVTTNLGTLSEIMSGERGILVEPSDAQSLAQAILFLADHREKITQIGENARRFAADLPDWDQVTFHFEELLNETVTGKDD